MYTLMLLLPIIVQVILSYVGLLYDIAALWVVIPVLNVVVIPCYLIAVIAAKKETKKVALKFIIAYIINIICCVMSCFILGRGAGWLINLDSVTILILRGEIVLPGVILAIGYIFRIAR